MKTFILSAAAFGISIVSLVHAVYVYYKLRLLEEDREEKLNGEPNEHGEYFHFEHMQKNDIIVEENGIVRVSDWSRFYQDTEKHVLFCGKIEDFCFANCPHFQNAIMFRMNKEPIFHCRFFPQEYIAKYYNDKRIKVVSESEAGK